MNKEELNKIMLDNPFTPLTDAIYQVLYNDIVRLYKSPGSKLNLSKIADELGVSRTPVRSALDKLVEDRLVNKVDNSKVFVVAHMTKEESNELYESRIAIEGYAAYLAVTNITSEQLKKLERLTERYTEICNSKKIDPIEYAECDHEFHSTIIEASANKYIQRMYKIIEGRLSHYRHCLIPEVGSEKLQPILNRAARRHQAIYNAFKFGFAENAKSAMEEDIGGMKDALRVWLEVK